MVSTICLSVSRRSATAGTPESWIFANCVSDEMIPETHHGETQGVTYALLVGFCLMLVSDVLLG